MKKDESKEVFIISQTDALIYPNTMMIKLFNTMVTNSAVFAASWFFELACWTLCILSEHQIVKFKLFQCLMLCLLIDVARVNCASFVVAVIASKHEEWTNIFMVAVNEGSWHLGKSIDHIYTIASYCTHQIHNLNDRVSRMTNIANGTINPINKRISTNASCKFFENVW